VELTRYVPIGQYLARESAIHALDPRTKILAVTCLSVGLFFVWSGAGFAVIAGIVAAGLVLGRIPLGYALRGLRPVIVLLALSVILNLLFAPSDASPVLARLGPVVITEGGLRTAAFIGIRLLLLVATTSLLTYTTSPVAMTDGIEWLLRPLRRFGVPGHELAMMMTIALRFIPTLLEETERIMKAQMARGADFTQGRLLDRARGFVPVLVPLFVTAFRRSEELALAMEARCYRGGEGRTRMHVLRWRAADAVALLVVAAASALSIATR
jgi:energy-coupling factor transport system permease protein